MVSFAFLNTIFLPLMIVKFFSLYLYLQTLLFQILVYDEDDFASEKF